MSDKFIRLQQTINLLTTDKSQYFVITEFKHRVCFHILITSWHLREAICHFSLENVVPITHEQNVISSKTGLDSTTHEQTIIHRQLFGCHMVGSRPMEKKRNASNDDDNYAVSTFISKYWVGQIILVKNCLVGNKC